MFQVFSSPSSVVSQMFVGLHLIYLKTHLTNWKEELISLTSQSRIRIKQAMKLSSVKPVDDQPKQDQEAGFLTLTDLTEHGLVISDCICLFNGVFGKILFVEFAICFISEIFAMYFITTGIITLIKNFNTVLLFHVLVNVFLEMSCLIRMMSVTFMAQSLSNAMLEGKKQIQVTYLMTVKINNGARPSGDLGSFFSNANFLLLYII